MVAAVLLLPAPPAAAADLSEDFDDVSALPGWRMMNLSDPIGDSTWRQGNPATFPARSGAPDSYISVDFTTGGDAGTLSNWLIAPQQATLSSTDVLTFSTRTLDTLFGEEHPDRLEVRMSSNGSCSPGVTSDSVGDFTTLLLTVNPELRVGGYPTWWTRYDLPLTGLGTTDASGCLAFRYFIAGGGPSGAQGDYIGIDTVRFRDNPSTLCIAAQALVETAKVPVAQARGVVSGAKTRLSTAEDLAGKATKKLTKAKKRLKKARKKVERGASVRTVTRAKRKVNFSRKVARRTVVKVRAARGDLTAAEMALTTATAALAAVRATAAQRCP